MFEFSLLEGVVIGLVALLVLGPTKLLEMSRIFGRWLGKLRRQYTDIKDELSREIELDEMRKRLADQERALREQMDVSAELHSIANPLADRPATATGQPAIDQPATDQPAADQPTTGQPPVAAAPSAPDVPAAAEPKVNTSS